MKSIFALLYSCLSYEQWIYMCRQKYLTEAWEKRIQFSSPSWFLGGPGMLSRTSRASWDLFTMTSLSLTAVCMRRTLEWSLQEWNQTRAKVSLKIQNTSMSLLSLLNLACSPSDSIERSSPVMSVKTLHIFSLHPLPCALLFNSSHRISVACQQLDSVVTAQFPCGFEYTFRRSHHDPVVTSWQRQGYEIW